MKILVVLLTLCLIGCATTTTPMTTRSQHIVRIKTCLHAVAHVDPGPIDDNATDGRMKAALHAYYAEFGRTDMMGMGRDPNSAEVQHDAIRALLLNCWKDGKLPRDDPLANRPFQPVEF